MINIKVFFEPISETFCYVVTDPTTNTAVVIDSVFGYDQYSGRTNTEFADSVIDYIKSENLNIAWVLDTHIHADHITAAKYLKAKVGGRIAIGSRITEVIKLWQPIFNNDAPLDGTQFDNLLADNEEITFGNCKIKVMHTPGHTPACASYLIEDAVFVGDTLFAPDIGTARTDFPGGSADSMYDSIMKILALPDTTRIYACHDYPLSARAVDCLSTVAEQKANNVMLQGDKQDYIKLRNARDLGKSVPKMLLPAIQTNMLAGDFGAAEKNSVKYVKIPVDKI